MEIDSAVTTSDPLLPFRRLMSFMAVRTDLDPEVVRHVEWQRQRRHRSDRDSEDAIVHRHRALGLGIQGGNRRRGAVEAEHHCHRAVYSRAARIGQIALVVQQVRHLRMQRNASRTPSTLIKTDPLMLMKVDPPLARANTYKFSAVLQGCAQHVDFAGPGFSLC